jgi:hypothetical protein
MKYNQYQRDLNTTLISEVLGERVFLTAARYARSVEQQQKWLILAQLETQTLKRLQLFLQQHGLTASIRFNLKLQATASGIAMAKLPWKVAMRLLKQSTKPFMSIFERMNQHADINTQGFLKYLLAHEQALAEFATKELRGEDKKSLEPVLALLEH